MTVSRHVNSVEVRFGELGFGKVINNNIQSILLHKRSCRKFIEELKALSYKKPRKRILHIVNLKDLSVSHHSFWKRWRKLYIILEPVFCHFCQRVYQRFKFKIALADDTLIVHFSGQIDRFWHIKAIKKALTSR